MTALQELALWTGRLNSMKTATQTAPVLWSTRLPHLRRLTDLCSCRQALGAPYAKAAWLCCEHAWMTFAEGDSGLVHCVPQG